MLTEGALGIYLLVSLAYKTNAEIYRMMPKYFISARWSALGKICNQYDGKNLNDVESNHENSKKFNTVLEKAFF